MLSLEQRGFTSALQMLRKHGYNYNFRLQGNCVYCSRTNTILQEHEFDANGMYYFPADKVVVYERMIYTIESGKHRMKGILLMTGAANTSVFSVMINRKLQESVSRQRVFFDHGIL